MDLVESVKKIKNKIKGKISFDENLSKFSWFNLGGPAKIVFRPNNVRELSFFLKKIKIRQQIKVLGVGSNTLIRDGGYDGIIIKLGNAFSHITLLGKSMLVSGVGILDKQLSNYALNYSISGFEFLR